MCVSFINTTGFLSKTLYISFYPKIITISFHCKIGSVNDMKKNIIIIILILSILMFVGCQQLDLSGGDKEPVICVPVSNISKICENVKTETTPVESVEEVVEPVEVMKENTTEKMVEETNVTNTTMMPVVNESSTEVVVVNTSVKINETVEVVETPVVEEEVLVDADYTVNEGDLLTVKETVSDPDGDVLIFTYSEPLDSEGSWQTSTGDAGVYTSTVTVSDGTNEASKQITIQVLGPKNTAPVIATLSDLTVDEGDTVSVVPVVSDADGDNVTVVISAPVGDDGTWVTSFDDAGEYNVAVTASDGVLETSKVIKVTVNNVNRAPSIDSLTAAHVNEGDMVQVNTVLSDLDNDSLSIAYGTPLDEMGKWQTAIGDAGSYDVNVTVSDGSLTETKLISFSVNAINNAPVISGISDLTVDEGDTVSVVPVVSDADGDNVTVVISAPVGDDGSWVTGFDDAGEYDVTVTASDAQTSVSQIIKVTVNDVNRAPSFE